MMVAEATGPIQVLPKVQYYGCESLTSIRGASKKSGGFCAEARGQEMMFARLRRSVADLRRVHPDTDCPNAQKHPQKSLPDSF